MACRVMGRRAARSVAVAGPRAASAAKMARRVGSARAVNTWAAAASRSGPADGGWSGGIEVAGQLGQLGGPACGVAVIGGAVGVLGQLGEPALHHGQPGARAGRLEGELDV